MPHSRNSVVRIGVSRPPDREVWRTRPPSTWLYFDHGERGVADLILTGMRR